MTEEEKTQRAENAASEKKSKSAAPAPLVYLHDLVYLVAIMMIVFLLLFRVVVVSGDSMNDTLLDGDYLLLVSSVFYRDPRPGDVIVAAKDSFEDGQPIVKRVIAAEGQHVRIDLTDGVVWVDGVALSEAYIKEEPYIPPALSVDGYVIDVTVDEGCVFVMGDNRNSSLDSRSPIIGQIDEREILGKAIFLFLPGTDTESGQKDFSRIGGPDQWIRKE